MSSKANQAKHRRQQQTFVGCLRKFLTPEVFGQAHKAHCRPHRDNRWTIQPLLLTLLAFTWCQGDSQSERFETARAFSIALRPKRKRPGKTLSSFHKALARLPMPVLRAVSAALRTRFLCLFARVLTVGGWIPFGCDGSRVVCPRSEELQARLGEAGKPDSAPTLWLTALVHLPTGLLWSWWLGKGTASERNHLVKLLVTLPAALVVCDAGYTGFGLAAILMDAQVSFLIRVSSQVPLYSLDGKPLQEWREGEVYYWPLKEQENNRGESILQNEMGKRGILSDLQTDAEQGEVEQPERGSGASRGGGVAPGSAVAVGTRSVGHVGAVAVALCGEQPARRAARDPQGDRGNSERSGADGLPQAAEQDAARAKETHQRQGKTCLAASQAAQAARRTESPPAVRRTQSLDAQDLACCLIIRYGFGIAWHPSVHLYGLLEPVAEKSPLGTFSAARSMGGQSAGSVRGRPKPERRCRRPGCDDRRSGSIAGHPAR